MKRILLSLCLLIGLSPALMATSPNGAASKGDKHHAGDHKIDLKQEAPLGNLTRTISLHGTIHMAGQPDEATVKSLKDKGYEVVINIRGADEVSFDEAGLVTAQGLRYHNLPLLKDGAIMGQAVDQIHHVIEENHGKKILLHCSSGNRVAGWLGAHLAKDMHMGPEKVIHTARQAGMTKAGMEKILRAYMQTLH